MSCRASSHNTGHVQKVPRGSGWEGVRAGGRVLQASARHVGVSDTFCFPCATEGEQVKIGAPQGVSSFFFTG